MRQSMSIYQRFSGEKCKQFSWIGFPSKPEPQETVKIELGRVGEAGAEGRRPTPAPFQTVPYCGVSSMEELISRLGEYAMH